MRTVTDPPALSPRPTTNSHDQLHVQLHDRDLHDLAEALERCPIVGIRTVPETDLGRCVTCPDTEDWPAFDAVAILARKRPGDRFPHRDNVCPGCLDIVAHRDVRAGYAVTVELPILPALPAPVRLLAGA